MFSSALIQFPTIDSKISVVNHSFTKRIITPAHIKFKKSFIQVSSIDSRKGIKELLDYFSVHPDSSLTLVGSGDLVELVVQYENRYANIHYAGYISSFDELEELYKENCFLLMNSHRSKGWEELFGMSIIEGMACGCVPITTDHSGPKEIIKPYENGIICQEGSITEGIAVASQMTQKEYDRYRINSINTGKGYYMENMKSRWHPIFDS